IAMSAVTFWVPRPSAEQCIRRQPSVIWPSVVVNCGVAYCSWDRQQRGAGVALLDFLGRPSRRSFFALTVPGYKGQRLNTQCHFPHDQEEASAARRRKKPMG